MSIKNDVLNSRQSNPLALRRTARRSSEHSPLKAVRPLLNKEESLRKKSRKRHQRPAGKYCIVAISPPPYSSPLFMPFILYQNFISYNMSDLPFGAFCYLRCFFGQLDSIHVHPTLTQKTTTFGIFSIDATAEPNLIGPVPSQRCL